MHDCVGGDDGAHHHLVGAACHVCGHLRSGPIRHFDQAEIGTLVEQLRCERGGPGGVIEGDRELARIRFGVGDQFTDRGNRQGRIHRQHLRTETAHQSHRREVARGRIGQLLERNEVDGHARCVGEQERVAVGDSARGGLVRQYA